MTQVARFCTNCGAPLNPGNRFCGGCGHAVEQIGASSAPSPALTQPSQRSAQQPAPPLPQVAPAPQYAPPVQIARPIPSPVAPQPAPTGEPIVGTAPGLQQRKGFMGVKAESYNLVVTPARLVFAYVSSDTMKAEVTEANREAKAQGKKWMGVVAAQMAWAQRLCAKYQSMTVEAILDRYPGSFCIANGEIKKVRLGAPSDDESNIQGVMNVETLSGKHSFDLVSVQPQDVKRLLQQTLGPLVK
jgi:hypothetical protein